MNPIDILKDYIGIRTDHPEPDYRKAVAYLQDVATKMGFETEVKQLTENNYSLLVYFRGKDSTLPAILLNSHIDVVKIDPDMWDYDPWGEIVEDKMYGRGTQDMKSLGIQQLFACYRLKERGFKPKRDVIVCFVPEEEVMGLRGMNILVDSLPPLLFALDEGIPSPDDSITIYPGERKTWWLKFVCHGATGHGSKYLSDSESAVVKMSKILNKFLEFAEKEKCKNEWLGDITTVNPSFFNAGNDKFYNVLPGRVEMGIDIRTPPSINLEHFFTEIKSWCDKDVEISFQNGTDINCYTNPSCADSEYMGALATALTVNKLYYNVKCFPASTDARYLRAIGVPTFGMSVLRNCPVLLHDHNEYIPIKSFLEGINVYVDILKQDL